MRTTMQSAISVLILLPLVVHAQSQDSMNAFHRVTLRQNLFQTYSPAGGGWNTSIFYDFRIGDQERFRGVGFYGSALRPLMATDSSALQELDEFKRCRIHSVIGAVVMLGSVIIAASSDFQKTEGQVYDPRTGRYETKYGSLTTTGIICLVGAVTGLVYGSYYFFTSTRHLFDAVDRYNRDLPGSLRNEKPVFEVGFGGTGVSVRVLF